MKLKDKFVLITGGAKRLGRILALLVAREGGSLLIHHRSSPDAASSLRNDILELGKTADIIQSDFSSIDARNNFINEVFENYDIDIVINNASLFANLDWKTTTVDNWRAHQVVNLETPFFISQAFAKSLPENKKGKIINMLDWRAQKPGADHLPYTISKAGLATLTKSLAVSLAPNITVNGIALGAILPPTTGGPMNRITDGLPISRWATISEFEETALFLLAAPDYITGEIIHLDGGRHLL